MIDLPNRPVADEVRDAYADRVRGLLEAIRDWTAAGPPETAEQAASLNDVLAGVRALEAEADADRVARKRPHDAAAKAVQDAFRPTLEALAKATDAAKRILQPYLDAAERREADAAAARAAEARRLADAAAASRALAQSSGDVLAEMQADAAALEAKRAAKVAAPAKVRVASASGGGRAVAQRTVRTARISDLTAAYFSTRQDPAVVEAILAAGQRMVRAATYDGEPIAGFTITEERKL